MYPIELEIKDTTESNTSASYLDLLLSIGRDGKLHTSIFDKRDDFNFHITHFPFLISNSQASPAYDIFISELIRYARAYSWYGCFIVPLWIELSRKYLGHNESVFRGWCKTASMTSQRSYWFLLTYVIYSYFNLQITINFVQYRMVICVFRDMLRNHSRVVYNILEPHFGILYLLLCEHQKL